MQQQCLVTMRLTSAGWCRYYWLSVVLLDTSARGFSYSWNLIAGHEKATAPSFRRQLVEEGLEKAIYEPRGSLPRFQGGLLDYNLRLLLPRETRSTPFDSSEATWVVTHFEQFNELASREERFRFALEAAIDWRFTKDARAAVARIWAGLESLLG